jgi:phage tail-like protein
MSSRQQALAHIETDPLRNFKFSVTVAPPGTTADENDDLFQGFAQMGFLAVSGLNIATELIPYREGGMNTTTQKLPGQSDFTPVTLTRGLVLGPQQAIWQWKQRLFAVMQGTGTGAPGADFRAMIEIAVRDHPVTTMTVSETPVKARFRLFNAWPTAVAFSDLDAGANAIIIQQMTLAYEGFDVAVAPSIGTAEAEFPYS